MSGIPKLSLRDTGPPGALLLTPVAAALLTGREFGGDVAGGVGGGSFAAGCESGRREAAVGGDIDPLSSGSLSCTAPIFEKELPLSGRSSNCVSLDDVGTYVLIDVGAFCRCVGVAV